MHSTAIKLLVSLAALAISIGFASAAMAETIALRAGHLIDPDKGTVLDDQLVRVEDGKILSISAWQNPPASDKVIDLSNSWVMPGMMDAHVHLTANHKYQNRDAHGSFARETESYRAVVGVRNAHLFLQAGFTTVKEIGNDGDYITAGIIQGIKEGLIDGPHIVYAGKIIAPYGGQMGGYNFRNEGAWRYEFIDADSPAELIKGIRQNVYFGADTIKLVSDQMRYFYTQEDIQAAVDEAHRAGLTLTVHVFGGEAARNVILGGADAIEHGLTLEDDELKLMKKHGTYLVGTDLFIDNWLAYNFTQEEAEEWSSGIVQRLKRAYEIGVPMVFGSDVIIDLPEKDRVQSSLVVLESWKKAGVPPMVLLNAMTANAADLMKLDGERGRLKEGLQADIIALSQNPLDDMNQVRSVHFVMKDGVVVRED